MAGERMIDILRTGLEFMINQTQQDSKKHQNQNPQFHQQNINNAPMNPKVVSPPSMSQSQSFGNNFETLTDIIARKERENNHEYHQPNGKNNQNHQWDDNFYDFDDRNRGDSRNDKKSNGDYWSNSYQSPFIRDEERQHGSAFPSASMWPEAPDFSMLGQSDDFYVTGNKAIVPPPIGAGKSGTSMSAIGAELRRINGSSPFEDHKSEDSDSRWEPASLWQGNIL